ncbi:hypothetical protein K435DRAFT_38091 [Dendrothele bispora CBS 962.96]|uniref:Uncharacterized protein n=1 Tax=Dendrothele bispora (strain CBS 962.96) TaxID=1314807 RepID=A0A4S8M7T6_DENBC|nr:hypothetical protein K435DRAFT_38091 [Dendrothele bispora CBS 962.96]
METQKIAALLTALAEKDKEIEALKLSLKAHAVRTSNVQTRLLATLDALDALQTSNSQDSELERQNYNRLKQKLYQYQRSVQECERERDDMREAVNALVEKVETSNNYALWSHSRMEISSRLGSFNVAFSFLCLVFEFSLLWALFV